MVARVYSQKQCTRGHFLRILTYPYPFSFNNCDSNRYEVILLCSSDLHFPDFCDVEHLFIYPLTICMVVCFFFKSYYQPGGTRNCGLSGSAPSNLGVPEATEQHD